MIHEKPEMLNAITAKKSVQFSDSVVRNLSGCVMFIID
jgi:hypothetical protein